MVIFKRLKEYLTSHMITLQDDSKRMDALIEQILELINRMMRNGLDYNQE